jgi:HlyD family secretion protein
MIFKKKQDAAVQQTAAGEAKPAAKGGKATAFFRKNWKWMVPVVCVAVLGGWFILRPDKAQNANKDINYVQVSPSKRDVSNTLSGTGTLNPANTYNVKSLVAGKVLTSSFEEGDIVEEGTVLYTVDSSDATTKAEQASIALQQAQRSYDKTADRQYVRAEVAGVVSALKVAKGDEVTSGQEVAVIRDSSKMVLRLEFPAADAATFSVGQSAEVTLDGTFEMLTGTVTAVTGTDALSTGNLLTRTVTIAVRNAGGLTTAQAATATINGVSCIAAKCFEYQAERTLTALAAGTVTAINVPEGGAVNKDDIVLQISGEDLTEAIQSAAESLRSAELNMDNLQEAMNNYTITSPISGTIIEKNAKAGDALSAGSDLCTIFDLSYLEMTLNVDELQVSSLSVGQSVQVTADAVPDKTYTGVVTRVSMKGTSNGGTTTYPVKVRIDETDGLRPGMNANAEIVVAQAKNTLTVPNAAIVRGGYVLVTQDSPSAVNADPGMIAPDGYVYVPVKTGVSDDNYTQIVSGLTGNDTVAYDSAAASTDTYYDDGGYYEADAEGTEGEEGADDANGMVDEAEPENGTVPAEEPVEAEEKQGSAEDAVNLSQADGVVYLG